VPDCLHISFYVYIYLHIIRTRQRCLLATITTNRWGIFHTGFSVWIKSSGAFFFGPNYETKPQQQHFPEKKMCHTNWINRCVVLCHSNCVVVSPVTHNTKYVFTCVYVLGMCKSRTAGVWSWPRPRLLHHFEDFLVWMRKMNCLVELMSCNYTQSCSAITYFYLFYYYFLTRLF
jgi:hypothetical protein